MMYLLFLFYLCVTILLIFILFRNDDLDYFYRKYRKTNESQKANESESTVGNDEVEDRKQLMKFVHSKLMDRLKLMKVDTNNRQSYKNVSIVYRQFMGHS